MPDWRKQGRIAPHLKNGLYRVTTPHFVAGFIVHNGHVHCAPILRRNLKTWLALGVWLGP